MLKACQYCGRVHDKRYVCASRHKIMLERDARQRERSERICRFRSSGAWQRKSEAIRSRDEDTCLVCRNEIERVFQCTGELTGSEVHHIVPLAVDYDKRLDDDNLITLCRTHHESAEAGEIDVNYLISLAAASEARS